ncbi:hypothetical protein [Gordonia tangerina]|uniref:Uncharacterized protein n=1 Tax=Gordonia tangerina TaxID=2911060 RepID=A0ABS9DMV5_9ACTN|nr:hypothetical protein [Gordonia tangerina]MCF3939924.1 hypothetical protein [Gordonia tangerina]
MSDLDVDAIEARATRDTDERFIAHARNDVLALVAQVRDLRRRVERHKHYAEGWQREAERAVKHGKFWAKERDEARAEVDRLIGMYGGEEQ